MTNVERRGLPNEEATLQLGSRYARGATAGDAFLLSGELGAGKTVFAHGFLGALGWAGAVRSPTYPILHPYPTSPPVLHADLYRLSSAEGIGIEDYESTHVLLIEWPDRLERSVGNGRIWRIQFVVTAAGREACIEPPVG